MLDWNLRPRAAYPGLLRARRGRCPLRAGRGDRSALADAGRAGQAGLRPGELSGLHGDRVDWLRGQIAVVDVMTRQGLRQYPKSWKSHRVVPVPPDVLEGLSVLMAGRPREALVFTAPEGGPGRRRERPQPGVVACRGRCGHSPVPAPDHAPHGRVLARD